jgi:hypothetical protein
MWFVSVDIWADSKHCAWQKLTSAYTVVENGATEAVFELRLR